MEKCKEKTEGKEEQEKRAYWHEVILYEEDADAAEVQARAEKAWDEWVSIVHDLDVEEGTGELKKAHIHLLLHSKSARTASAVGKILRLPANMVEQVKNGQAALAYLTHSTDRARMEGKHPYPTSALSGPLAQQAAEAAERARGAASEGAQVMTILEYIGSASPQQSISMAELASWAASQGLWASFRRAAIIFKTIMEEHNAIAEAIRRREDEAAPPSVDPLRFAKLRAGQEKPAAARVDMEALEAVSR